MSERWAHLLLPAFRAISIGSRTTGAWQILPLRQLADPGTGRVKAYRKQAGEGILPPVLLGWISGLDCHVLLDGHDRIGAALSEKMEPPFLSLERQVIAGAPGAADALAGVNRRLAENLTTIGIRYGATQAWPLRGGTASWNALAAAHVPTWHAETDPEQARARHGGTCPGSQPSRSSGRADTRTLLAPENGRTFKNRVAAAAARPAGFVLMGPPESVNAGELVLKRWEPAWAADATVAIRESLPELKLFLPWATDDYDEEASRAFIEKSVADWAEGTTFNYCIFTAAGDLVGGLGLMTRMGPGALEIGYWTRTAYTRRGYMTAAVEALTRIALTLPGIERVAIRHDVANAASAAVALKAGFVEASRVDREPQAPGETGTDVIRERRADPH